MEDHIEKENIPSDIENAGLSDGHKTSRLSVMPLVFCGILLIISLVITCLYFFYQKQPVKTQATTQIPVTKAAKLDYNLTAVPLEQDIASASYTIIPETDLQIKIPQSFKIRKSGHDVFLPIGSYTISARTDIAQIRYDVYDCKSVQAGKDISKDKEVESYINSGYCKSLVATNFKRSPEEDNPYYHVPNSNSFDIAVVAASSSSVENWILDNFHPQGENLREQPNTVLDIKQRVIGGQTFYGYHVGCCGKWEIVYFYPYLYKDKQLLIMFIDEETVTVPDAFLETILATLKKTQ